MKKNIKNRIRNIDYIVSQNLRKRRLIFGLTQQEIATVLGVSVQQVQKYENGINRISSGKLYRLAHLLELPLINFFIKHN